MSQTHNDRLATEPLLPLILKLAIPSVTAQLVNVLYNIVDRMYIGHIEGVGATALTGLGVAMPIITLISAVSSFIGMSGAPLAAIELGRQNKNKAEKILGNGVTALICLSLFLTIFFYIFKEPMLYAFGGSDNTIKYSLDYLNVYLLGTIFVQLSLGLNMFISCQGQAKTAMMSVVIGAVINIILDPIFIFGLNMGVKGAGLATIIAQACSAIWILKFLLSKKSTIRIKKANLKIEWKIITKVMLLGLSPFIMQSTESLVAIVLNSGLQNYGGDNYVTAMTVLQSTMMMVFVPIMGISQGIQPILSYNYGAKNPERLKKTFGYTFVILCIICILTCITCFLIPEQIGSIFIKDQVVLSLIKKVMPIFMGGVWIFGVQNACQFAFLGFGKAKISIFLALLRKVILLVPLAIILPMHFDVIGIFYSEPIADIIAGMVTGTTFFFSFKYELRQMEKNKILEEMSL